MPGTIHVVAPFGRWAIMHEGDDAPTAEFEEHEIAEQAARDHARRHGDTKVVVHSRRGGDVRDVHTPSAAAEVIEGERRQRREH